MSYIKYTQYADWGRHLQLRPNIPHKSEMNSDTSLGIVGACRPRLTSTSYRRPRPQCPRCTFSHRKRPHHSSRTLRRLSNLMFRTHPVVIAIFAIFFHQTRFFPQLARLCPAKSSRSVNLEIANVWAMTLAVSLGQIDFPLKRSTNVL
jgi:hypothetical protein